MSYTPTTWQSGDIITAEKLNKLENGVASGGSQPLVVNLTTENGLLFTFDKTFGEIYDAIQAGQTVVLASSYSSGSEEIIQNAIINSAVIQHDNIGYEDEKYYGFVIVSLTPYQYVTNSDVYYTEGDTITEIRADYPYHNYSD